VVIGIFCRLSPKPDGRNYDTWLREDIGGEEEEPGDWFELTADFILDC